MQRYAPLFFALALIGAACAPPVAQAQGRSSVCFYEHVNFQGRAYCIRVGERVDFVGPSANDQFSSVRVPRGAAAFMCEHANFRGHCMTLHHSEANFVPLGFNDIVSAVAARWEGDGGRYGGPPDHGWDQQRSFREDRDRRQYEGDRRGRGRDVVCFYEHDHYRGRRYCAPVGAAVPWVGRQYNDIFSSLQMPRGVVVTVCRDSNFQGPCTSFRRDIDFFGGGWNDTISSFRSH